MRREDTAHGVSLVTGYEDIIPDLLRRLLLVLALIAFVTGVLWIDRDGLQDRDPDDPLSFIDVFYYTMVTITTVGYGDIVPITQRARLISSLVVAPVRVIVLILFIGTAYQLALQRYREANQMQRTYDRLKDHIIICGYGVKGHATVDELLSFGRRPDDIVIIDADPSAADDAAREGLTAFRGNATEEGTLKAAAVEKAYAIIVNLDRDDSTVLVCLTAKHLNPSICVIAAAREAENVPLIYRSGADVVVASPVAGGRMLAIATQFLHVPRFLDDILSFGRGLDFGEKHIEPAEAGLTLDQLPDMAGKLPIGAYHRGERYAFDRLDDMRFDAGDVVIYLASKPGTASDQETVTSNQ